MLTLIDLLTALLPLLYGLATANYAVYFVRRDPFAERTCTAFTVFVFVLHGAFFALRAAHFGRPPIVSMPEMLSAVALAVAGVYLYVERIQRSKVTGVFLLGAVLLLQLASSTLVQHAPTASANADSRFLGLHIMAAVLGYSAFAVGAVYGVMYVLLYRALKAKRFGIIFERLPSLDTLASMGFGATLLGWVLLTATIAFGLFMGSAATTSPYADPHTFSTIFVWAIYGLSVLMHFGFGWRGARAVYLTLAGFAFAMLAMLGAALWPHLHTFST
jgi:ABC-type uncharacterized transport system permease subunit